MNAVVPMLVLALLATAPLEAAPAVVAPAVAEPGKAQDVLPPPAAAIIAPASKVAGEGGPKVWPASTNRHQVVIVREADSDALRALIARAEAHEPDQAALRAAAKEITLPTKPAPWWYREALGVRVPFAITGAAVDYYRDLVTGYSKVPMKRYTEPSSRLEYRATAKARPTFEHEGRRFENVRVVTLRIDFRQFFCATQTEGMHFTKERTLVFDAAGKLLLVTGDGPTEAPVLAI